MNLRHNSTGQGTSHRKGRKTIWPYFLPPARPPLGRGGEGGGGCLARGERRSPARFARHLNDCGDHFTVEIKTTEPLLLIVAASPLYRAQKLKDVNNQRIMLLRLLSLQSA